MNAVRSNRASLELFYTAAMTNDRATVESLLHPDFTVFEADGLPYAGAHKGHKAWWKLFDGMASIWLDLKIENLDLIGEPNGELFGWYMRMSGRSAASAKAFSLTIFERWVVKDGKLMECRPHYWDTKMLSDINAAKKP